MSKLNFSKFKMTRTIFPRVLERSWASKMVFCKCFACEGFTSWLAGAGVKAPFSYGATDDFSYKAVENVATVYDFYATVLHILGLDHERLSFYHNGIERRLTDVHGHVIRDILA